MEKGHPSDTAIISAMTRASHLYVDDDPKIFVDDLALALSGVKNESELRQAIGDIRTEIAKQTTPEFADSLLKYNRANITLRQRYAEDELAKAIESGTMQYVSLGAGLDSYAYCRQDPGSTLGIFEVDFPATQQWKKSLLGKLGIGVPDNLTFVPVDFEKQTLADALLAVGFQADKPTYFSWLGVSMYLTDAAIFDTLKYVASLATGSQIVFQYYLKDSLLSDEGRELLAAYESTTAARGEPWLSFFEPTELTDRVLDLGFADVKDLGVEQANALYFAGRQDGLHDAGLSHHMKARV